MKYNPKAKLKVRQINDKRTWMGATRTGATGTDGAEKPPSVDQARAEELSRRYGQTVWSKPYQPVGHVRYDTPQIVRHGNIAIRENVPERPDGADRTQPFKNKHVKIKRTGTSH